MDTSSTKKPNLNGLQLVWCLPSEEDKKIVKPIKNIFHTSLFKLQVVNNYYPLES